MHEQLYLSDELELQARLAAGDRDLDILDRLEVIEDYALSFKALSWIAVLDLLFHLRVIARDDDGLPDISRLPKKYVERVAQPRRHDHWDEPSV
tara:strand:+ start:1104 stop:1385 length:282 start_codon:yes stop_codon:yes gene_type:complete